MPKWLHKQLTNAARKKGLYGDKADKYIYGTLNKYKNRLHKSRVNALSK